jgi:DNA processing protein
LILENELLGLMTLARIPGIGDVLLKQLVAYSGSAVAVLNASGATLAKIPGIGSVLVNAIVSNRNECRTAAENELTRLIQTGGRAIHYLQAEYPSRLRSIPDAPPVIYARGTFTFDNPKVLAIVGTRQATSYGKAAVESFLEQLQEFRPVVVSGLAYGIDIHAHKTALQLGLETWAVMGTSLNQIYPGPHKSIAAKIEEQGGLLTEVPLDAEPEPSRFPARNRIIAGLADAVFVVEAMEKGGALITARLAADYFRDVFALPGNIGQATSAGCNALITSNIASLASSGSAIGLAMGWTPDSVGKKVSKSLEIPADLSAEDASVIKLMLQGEIHLDEIAWKSGIPVNRVAGILLNMEFAGHVKSLPGKKFAIRD